MSEKIYELKKDATFPGGYIRAGARNVPAAFCCGDSANVSR